MHGTTNIYKKRKCNVQSKSKILLSFTIITLDIYIYIYYILYIYYIYIYYIYIIYIIRLIRGSI